MVVQVPSNHVISRINEVASNSIFPHKISMMFWFDFRSHSLVGFGYNKKEERNYPVMRLCSVQIIVGYWSIRGLGASIRMICEYAGVLYTALNYSVVDKGDGGLIACCIAFWNHRGMTEQNFADTIRAPGLLKISQWARPCACVNFLHRRQP